MVFWLNTEVAEYVRNCSFVEMIREAGINVPLSY